MTGPTRPDPGPNPRPNPGPNPRPNPGPESGRHAAGPAPVRPEPARPAGPADPRPADPPAPPVAAGPPPWRPENSRRLPGWIAPAALALGVISTAVSLWAVKTASDNAPVALGGDSKVRVCSAFATVAKAVKLQTNGGPEPLPEPLAATNSRQALLAGGDYLMQQVDKKTPGDLAAAAVTFANDIQMLGLNYLGGAVSTEPGQADLIKRADASMTKVGELCK